MTEEPDEDLTPEQEDQIRSALASARVTGSTPDHVAARLDVALAHLVAGRDRPEEAARETGRNAGRRGRWLLLAGAASVAAIVAFSVPALRPNGVGGSTSADSSAARSAPKTDQGGSRSPLNGTDRLEDGLTAEPPPIRLSTGSFGSDVRRLLAGDNRDVTGLAPESTRSSADAPGSACVAAAAPPGVTQQRRVLLDGEPALLEVYRARRGTRLVRAVSCGAAETLASTRIAEH